MHEWTLWSYIDKVTVPILIQNLDNEWQELKRQFLLAFSNIKMK